MSKNTHFCERNMNFSASEPKSAKIAQDLLLMTASARKNHPCLPNVYPLKRLVRKGLRDFRNCRRLPFRLPDFVCRLSKHLILRHFLLLTFRFPWGYVIAYLSRFCNFSPLCTKARFRAGAARMNKVAENERKTARICNGAEPKTEISERRVTLYEKVTRTGAGVGHVHVPRHHQLRGLQGCRQDRLQ